MKDISSVGERNAIPGKLLPLSIISQLIIAGVLIHSTIIQDTVQVHVQSLANRQINPSQ